MNNIKVDDYVKVLFAVEDSGDGCTGERLWVHVTKLGSSRITGTLANDPVVIDLEYGDTVRFNRGDVLEIEDRPN